MSQMTKACRKAGILEGDPLDELFAQLDWQLAEIANLSRPDQRQTEAAFYRAGMVVAQRLAVRLAWWWALGAAAAGGLVAGLSAALGYCVGAGIL